MGWGLRTCFFDKTPEDLGLLLYPETFQTKWSFTPGISRNYVTPYGNSKASIQDSWKLYMMFFYQPCKFVSLARGISTFCFFNTPENSMSSTPPCIFFSEIAHSKHLHWQFFITYIFPVSDEQLINILLQKFDTLSKKEVKRIKNVNIWCKTKKNKQKKKNCKNVYVYQYKVAFLSLLWTRPIDPWCNMFRDTEGEI